MTDFRKIVFALLFLFGVGTISAQHRFSDNLKLVTSYQYGFVLPEYSFVSQIVNQPINGVEFSVLKEASGENEFEQVFNYPERGVSFLYSTLGNKEVLGTAIGVNYFFRLNIIDKPRFKVYNRMGIGLGYLSRKNDLSDNYWNVAIGSHVNVYYNCRLGARYQLFDKWELNTGLTFDHFSNGNTSEPNIGLNNFSGFIGTSYLVGERIERKVVELSPPERKFYFESFLSVGGKHTRTFSSKYFLATSFATEVGYSIFRGFHLGAGVDLFYDSSIEQQKMDKNLPYKSSEDFQSGIHFSQTIVYRKFRFTLQEGFYIGLKEPMSNKPMYNRGILRYYLNDKWSIRLAMKSHLHILDYPEIGVGYKWK